MKDADSAPSPSKFWMKFGVRSDARQTSSTALLPKKNARTCSRTRPAMRLRKMPAPTSQAAREVTARGGTVAVSAIGLAFRRRESLARSLGQQLLHELALLVQTSQLG